VKREDLDGVQRWVELVTLGACDHERVLRRMGNNGWFDVVVVRARARRGDRRVIDPADPLVLQFARWRRHHRARRYGQPSPAMAPHPRLQFVVNHVVDDLAVLPSARTRTPDRCGHRRLEGLRKLQVQVLWDHDHVHVEKHLDRLHVDNERESRFSRAAI